MKFFKLLSGLIIVGLSAGFAFYLYVFRSENIRPKTFDLYIPTGADYSTVEDSLVFNGVLLNKMSFAIAARILKYPQLVKPGRYVLTEKMNNKMIIDILRTGQQTPVRLTFHTISFFEELASITAGHLEADSTTFLNYFTNEKHAQQYGFSKETFRLMFIPDTYEFFWNTSPEIFSKRMYAYYQNFWTSERIEMSGKIGLTPIEIGILASIVESETKKTEEMPIVAGLYINRLRKNIPLQADPTVVYATQLERGSRSRRVYFKDLKTDSPYNTYLYKGLPPGPILFPSKAALLSVLHAEKHNYLYMCADPEKPGYHLFTADYQQHLRNAVRYHRWLNSHRIN
ncbi:MAG: endolytic transglycosylase MltG [Thermaurantimonas sp.]